MRGRKSRAKRERVHSSSVNPARAALVSSGLICFGMKERMIAISSVAAIANLVFGRLAETGHIPLYPVGGPPDQLIRAHNGQAGEDYFQDFEKIAGPLLRNSNQHQKQ
jgi:hypothetical protein